MENQSSAEKFLALKESLNQYQAIFRQASDLILRKQATRYPIFVVYQEPEVEVGIKLVDREHNRGPWNIRVSSLEEFVQKGLIRDDKVESFKQTYKDPQGFFCIFVMSELGAQFAYLPKIFV